MQHLQHHEIIVDSWKSGEPPQDWEDAQFITLYKRGDRCLCGKYCGISLLSTPGKVLACVLLKRLSFYAEDLLPEAQCGFCAGEDTVDDILPEANSRRLC